MPQLIVSDEQARIIAEAATESLEVCDQAGRHLGYLVAPFTAEDIAIAQERMASAEPRYTTQQVLEHLRSFSSGTDRIVEVLRIRSF